VITRAWFVLLMTSALRALRSFLSIFLNSVDIFADDCVSESVFRFAILYELADVAVEFSRVCSC
jgi:hypothetical protein